MPVPFGPQLIGQTEKALNALLRTFLEPTGLTEPQWVTLRVAEQLAGTSHPADLVDAVEARTHLPDVPAIVRQLTARGLLAAGRPTVAGCELLAAVKGAVDGETRSLWSGHDPGDVAAATRVLHEVLVQAEEVLERPSVRR